MQKAAQHYPPKKIRRSIKSIPLRFMRTGSFTTLLVSPLRLRKPSQSLDNPECHGENDAGAGSDTPPPVKDP